MCSIVPVFERVQFSHEIGKIAVEPGGAHRRQAARAGESLIEHLLVLGLGRGGGQDGPCAKSEEATVS